MVTILNAEIELFIESYLSELRLIIKECKYGNVDEHLFDQLILTVQKGS